MLIILFMDLIESIGYTYCLSKYLKNNDKYKKEYALFMMLISFVILQINATFSDVDGISIFVINIFGFLYSYIFFSNSILEILYILLFSESMILYSNIISLNFVSYVFQINLSELSSVPLNFEVFGLFSKILYLVIIIGLSKVKRVYSSIYSKSIIYLFFVHLIIFISTSYMFIQVMSGNLDYEYIDVIVVLLSSIFVLLYFMYNKLKEENEKYLENLIIEKETENMKEYLKTFSIIYEENKMIRHDLKNALLSLNEKLSSKDEILKEIQEYTYTLPTFFTTNNTFNDIVNSKILLYKEKNVEWRFYIESDLEKIKKIDLAIILGNLLDNACENLGKDKILEIHTKSINGLYFLNVRNSVDFSVLEKNRKLTSKKPNQNFHGYGIISINKIIKKYNGNISFSEENNTFNVDIFFEIPILTN